MSAPVPTEDEFSSALDELEREIADLKRAVADNVAKVNRLNRRLKNKKDELQKAKDELANATGGGYSAAALVSMKDKIDAMTLETSNMYNDLNATTEEMSD